MVLKPDDTNDDSNDSSLPLVDPLGDSAAGTPLAPPVMGKLLPDHHAEDPTRVLGLMAEEDFDAEHPGDAAAVDEADPLPAGTPLDLAPVALAASHTTPHVTPHVEPVAPAVKRPPTPQPVAVPVAVPLFEPKLEHAPDVVPFADAPRPAKPSHFDRTVEYQPNNRALDGSTPYAAVLAVPASRPLRLLPTLAPFETLASRWGYLMVAGLVTVLYFGLLLAYWAPAHPGVDQNGYLVGGKYLAHTGSTGFKPIDPFGFVGNMYVQTGDGESIKDFPKYPIGLSFLYACSLWAFGDVPGGPGYVYSFLVSPIGAALAVFGTFMTVRLFASNFAAVMAMLLLGFSQVVLTLANNPNSHAACMGVVVWGGFFLVRFWQTGSVWRGLVAGFLLGFAVTIRYTEGLLALLIAWTAVTMWDWRARWGVLGAALLLIGAYTAKELIAPNSDVTLIRAGMPPADGAAAIEWQFGLAPWKLSLIAGASILAGLALLLTWLNRFGYRTLWQRARANWLPRAIVGGVAVLVAAGGYFFLARKAGSMPKKIMFDGIVALAVLTAIGALLAPLFARATWMNFLRGWAPTIGWALPVGYLLGFNKIAMGSWTGYDTTNESTAFTMENFYDNWERMIRQIHDTGMFFVLPVGLLGMVLMYRKSARVATMLWLWLLPGSLLYAAYYWAPEARNVAYLRFFMTLFPPVVLGAGYLMYALGGAIGGTLAGECDKRAARAEDASSPASTAAPSPARIVVAALVLMAGLLLVDLVIFPDRFLSPRTIAVSLVVDALLTFITVAGMVLPKRGATPALLAGMLLLRRLGVVALATFAGLAMMHFLEPALHLGWRRAIPLTLGLGALAAFGALFITWRERYALRPETVAASDRSRTPWFASYAQAAVPVIAAGAIVAGSAGMGLYRAVLGMEDGGRNGMSIENAQRSNGNLALLGQTVTGNLRDGTVGFRAPRGALLFSNANELHYLQYVGDFECFDVQSFTGRAAQRVNSSFTRFATPEDPDPLQGKRLEYLMGVYKGKSDRDLVNEQNRVMDDAFAAGREVYVVLDKGAADNFRSRYLKSTKYKSTVVGRCKEIPRIPTAEELKAALDAPDAGRRTRNMFRGGRGPQPPGDAWASDAKLWQVIRVTPIPTKPPSTQPTPGTPA